MIAHLVLFRPKAGWTRDTRSALAGAIAAAARDIPAVRRFVIGERLVEGPAYAVGAPPDFPFFALVELETRGGLLAYLQHPSHARLGRLFNETLEAAMVFDYEVSDVAAVEG